MRLRGCDRTALEIRSHADRVDDMAELFVARGPVLARDGQYIMPAQPEIADQGRAEPSIRPEYRKS